MRPPHCGGHCAFRLLGTARLHARTALCAAETAHGGGAPISRRSRAGLHRLLPRGHRGRHDRSPQRGHERHPRAAQEGHRCLSRGSQHLVFRSGISALSQRNRGGEHGPCAAGRAGQGAGMARGAREGKGSLRLSSQGAARHRHTGRQPRRTGEGRRTVLHSGPSKASYANDRSSGSGCTTAGRPRKNHPPLLTTPRPDRDNRTAFRKRNAVFHALRRRKQTAPSFSPCSHQKPTPLDAACFAAKLNHAPPAFCCAEKAQAPCLSCGQPFAPASRSGCRGPGPHQPPPSATQTCATAESCAARPAASCICDAYSVRSASSTSR